MRAVKTCFDEADIVQRRVVEESRSRVGLSLDGDKVLLPSYQTTESLSDSWQLPPILKPPVYMYVRSLGNLVRAPPPVTPL
jgi:hypothetical protein